MRHVILSIALPEVSLARLRAVPGVEVHWLAPADAPVERPADLLRQTRFLIAKHPPANFDDLTSLQAWQLATVGFEHLAHLRLGARPFAVCNARGLFDTAIAEWNVAMMVNLTRDLRGMIRRQERGQWEKLAAFTQEIRGKVAGIWGYGGIGRETARLARAMGLIVNVMTRRGVRPRRGDFTPAGTGDPDGVLPDRAFGPGQEREFLADLDFLILALPRSAATTGLLGERELRWLKPTAFLLNPARGPLVVEADLVRALSEGWIAGAALDTHHHYPMPPDHPLWAVPNVIMTPHVSGADKSDRFPALMGELCVENVTRWATGRELLNVVSREDLDANDPLAG